MQRTGNQNQVFRAVAEAVLGHRVGFVLAMLAVTAVAVWQIALHLRIDNSTDYFLGAGSELVQVLEQYRDDFGRDDLHLVLVEGDVFSAAFLERLATLHAELEALDVEVDAPPAPVAHADPYADLFDDFGEATAPDSGVIDEVISLINFPQTVLEHGAVRTRGLLDTPPPDGLEGLRARVLADPVMVGNVVDASGRYAVLGVRTVVLEESDVDRVNAEIVALAETHASKGFRVQVTGVPDLAASVNQRVRFDLGALSGLAFLAMSAILYALFRHPIGVVGPMVAVSLAAVWTLGLMSALGMPVSVITNILPSFLLCAGLCDAVHIQSTYRGYRSADVPHHEAIVSAIGGTGIPMLFTTATTAAGLLAFQTAHTAAIRELGLAGAAGVVFALITSLVLVPVTLSFDRAGKMRSRRGGRDAIDSLLAWTTGLSDGIARRRRTFAGALALVAVAAVGVSQLAVFHDAMTWLREDHRSRAALMEMDEHVGGVQVVHLVIDAGERGITDPELLRGIEDLQATLGDWVYPLTGERLVTNSASVLDVLRETNRALHDGDPAFYAVPQTREAVSQALLLFESADPDALRRLATADLQRTHVTFRLHWQETSYYLPFTAFLDKAAQTHLGGMADVHVTGMVHNTTHIMGSFVPDLIRSMGAALLIVTLMLLVLLRDVRLGLVALVPGLLPIGFILGFMGFAGVPLELTNLLLGSIVIGIAVDDTVHYLHQFRAARMAGFDTEAAIRHSLQHAGRAMVTTSLILCIGFSVFLASGLYNLKRFGLLVAVTCLMALFVALILTPALLRALYGAAEPVAVPIRRPAYQRAALAAAVVAALVGVAWTASAAEPDPRGIMETVEGRERGDRLTARLRITITDRAERERRRDVALEAMDFEGGRKQFVQFVGPADVRDTALLSVEWDEEGRTDDQWLYLPSLGRTTRIASADRSGSFMGTDLTYADLTARDPDQYDYTLVHAGTLVDGEACWVIETVPRTAEEREETGYARTHIWVSKTRMVPLQVKAWVADARKVKFTRMLDIREIDGVYVTHRLVVRTVDNGEIASTSVLDFSDVTLGDEAVSDASFSLGRLERSR